MAANINGISQLLVYGYIRLLTSNSDLNETNKIPLIPNDIIHIIHSFFMLTIPSQILNIQQNIAFINTVSIKFNHIKQFDLLYSSLKHGLSKESYIKYCDDHTGFRNPILYYNPANNNQRINLIIIKNKNDHIFGAYREWEDANNDWNTDSFFLFVISPEIHIFDKKQPQKVIIYSLPAGQPIFNLYANPFISQDFGVYYKGDKIIATSLSGCKFIDGIDRKKIYGTNSMYDTDGLQVTEMEVYTAVKYT